LTGTWGFLHFHATGIGEVPGGGGACGYDCRNNNGGDVTASPLADVGDVVDGGGYDGAEAVGDWASPPDGCWDFLDEVVVC
jgi:hypothetical protein